MKKINFYTIMKDSINSNTWKHNFTHYENNITLNFDLNKTQLIYAQNGQGKTTFIKNYTKAINTLKQGNNPHSKYLNNLTLNTKFIKELNNLNPTNIIDSNTDRNNQKVLWKLQINKYVFVLIRISTALNSTIYSQDVIAFSEGRNFEWIELNASPNIKIINISSNQSIRPEYVFSHNRSIKTQAEAEVLWNKVFKIYNDIISDEKLTWFKNLCNSSDPIIFVLDWINKSFLENWKMENEFIKKELEQYMFFVIRFNDQFINFIDKKELKVTSQTMKQLIEEITENFSFDIFSRYLKKGFFTESSISDIFEILENSTKRLITETKKVNFKILIMFAIKMLDNIIFSYEWGNGKIAKKHMGNFFYLFINHAAVTYNLAEFIRIKRDSPKAISKIDPLIKLTKKDFIDSQVTGMSKEETEKCSIFFEKKFNSLGFNKKYTYDPIEWTIKNKAGSFNNFSTGENIILSIIKYLSENQVSEDNINFIIVDDPTDSLDMIYKNSIIYELNNMIKDDPKNSLSIIASHDIEIIEKLSLYRKQKNVLLLKRNYTNHTFENKKVKWKEYAKNHIESSYVFIKQGINNTSALHLVPAVRIIWDYLVDDWLGEEQMKIICNSFTLIDSQLNTYSHNVNKVVSKGEETTIKEMIDQFIDFVEKTFPNKFNLNKIM